MKINNEKLVSLISELTHEVEGWCVRSEKPVGVVDDGKIITVVVYSESEARECGFDADDVESLIEFDELKQQNEILTRDYEVMKALYETDLEDRDKAVSELLEFVEEVRRTGDTRLASMVIAVIAKAKGEQFPQPSKKTGGDPCGECHLQAGETCDICGAIAKAKGEW